MTDETKDVEIDLPLLKNAKYKAFSYERGLAVGYIIGALSSQVDDNEGILGTLSTTLGSELDGEEIKIADVLEEIHNVNMELMMKIANASIEGETNDSKG